MFIPKSDLLKLNRMHAAVGTTRYVAVYHVFVAGGVTSHFKWVQCNVAMCGVGKDMEQNERAQHQHAADLDDDSDDSDSEIVENLDDAFRDTAAALSVGLV